MRTSRGILRGTIGPLIPLTVAVLLAAPGMATAAGTSLLRTTLVVADVGRSLAFYQALGFRVEREIGGPRRPDSPFPTEVGDLPGVLQRLAAVGARTVEAAPVPYEMTRPDGSLGAGQLVQVYDPDHHLIELMQPSAVDATRTTR